LATELRAQNLKIEVYPQVTKLKKSLDYANNKQIKWAVIVGENELKEGKVMLKNLETGDQNLILKTEIIKHLN
jgi:histidyl-tRNA synthetase